MLRKIFLIVFAFMVFFGSASLVYQYKHPAGEVVIIINSDFKDKTFDLVNEQRTKAGLKPVARNMQLDESARLKLTDMVNQGYFDHYDPEGNPPWKFFSEAGYNYHFAGENLAKDFITPDGFVSGWMASTTHKGIILDPNFTEAGIAIEVEKGGKTFAVEHFASPQ
jgi:uncharacterized protein YkwD